MSSSVMRSLGADRFTDWGVLNTNGEAGGVVVF